MSDAPAPAGLLALLDRLEAAIKVQRAAAYQEGYSDGAFIRPSAPVIDRRIAADAAVASALSALLTAARRGAEILQEQQQDQG